MLNDIEGLIKRSVIKQGVEQAKPELVALIDKATYVNQIQGGKKLAGPYNTLFNKLVDYRDSLSLSDCMTLLNLAAQYHQALGIE